MLLISISFSEVPEALLEIFQRGVALHFVLLPPLLLHFAEKIVPIDRLVHAREKSVVFGQLVEDVVELAQGGECHDDVEELEDVDHGGDVPLEPVINAAHIGHILVRG